MKKLYFIENVGCDATTYGLIELDEQEFKKFTQFVKDLNRNSYYDCMPTIRMFSVSWDDFKKIEVSDDNFERSYERLWFNDQPYTYAENVYDYDIEIWGEEVRF